MINGGALISGYFDGMLSDAEVAELQAWLVSDPGNAKLFAKHAILHQQMGILLGTERTLRITQTQQGSTSSFHERQSEPAGALVNMSSWTSRLENPESDATARPRWKKIAWIGAAAAVLVLGVGGVYLWNRFPAVPPSGQDEETVVSQDPACITRDAEPIWGDASNAQLRDLVAGKSLTLVAGYAEVTFAGGAKVVVQGPSTFTINSSQELTLDSGRLTAIVQGGGFVVHTPAAKVTDLGTEFGVVVRDHGGTLVEVYKGRVSMEGMPRLQAAATDTAPSAAHTLVAGDCAKMDEGMFAMVSPASSETLVRNLSSIITSLNLVDILCGGDGTTHRRGVGIDVATGDAGALKQVEREVGDDHYHRVPALPMVDGCFVPDGASGPNQVDSAGHMYLFPATSKASQGLLWAGASPQDPYWPRLSSAILGATDFSEAGHAALFMYTNKGLTLDLGKMPHPAGVQNWCAFRATVGNTYTKMIRAQRTFPKSDIFVLVDGEVRFKRIGFMAQSGPFTLEVPLKPTDRFVTLVTSDGGDTRKDDYIIWGDPTLELRRETGAAQVPGNF